MNQHVSEIISQETNRILADTVSDKTYPVILDELMETFGEIVAELMVNAPDKKDLIYDLIDLLRQENKLYQPLDAYEAGVCSQRGEQHASFMDYARKIVESPEAIALFAKRDAIFYELIELLGKTCGLVTDFLEYYRKCNNVISRNINVFFDLGFTAG